MRSPLDADTLAALAQLGHRYFQEDRLDDALVVFQGLLSFAPKNGYLLRALAETSLAREDYPSALRAANGAIAVEPQEAAGYLLRGRVLLASDRQSAARNDLTRAARLGDELARLLLASCVERSETPAKQFRARRAQSPRTRAAAIGTRRE